MPKDILEFTRSVLPLVKYVRGELKINRSRASLSHKSFIIERSPWKGSLGHSILYKSSHTTSELEYVARK